MDKPIEVMRIVRRPPLGKLVVEQNGRQFERLAEVNNPQAAQMMLAAIGELVAFAGGYEALVAAGFAPELRGGNRAGETSASLEEQQAAFLAQLQNKNPATSEETAPSFFRLRRPTAPPVESNHLDIVSALDDLFQKQLVRMPELSSHHVRVETNLKGGTRINVNGRYYDDAADIPNPMIRLAYKMAVREWETAANNSAV